MKTYTRDEKIQYYNDKIKRLEAELTLKSYKLDALKQRLEHIQSDEYQDWNSDLQKQLDNK